MIFRPELARAVLDGSKTVTRRPRTGANPSGEAGGWVDDPCRYKVGKTYAVQMGRSKPAVGRILILSVRPETMSELSEDEIEREGFASRRAFEMAWKAIYGRGSYLDLVWRIEFELAETARAA